MYNTCTIMIILECLTSRISNWVWINLDHLVLIKEIHKSAIIQTKIFVIKWKEIRENTVEFKRTWVVSTHVNSGKFRF